MAGPPRNRGAFFVQGRTYAAEDRTSGSGVVQGRTYAAEDRTSGSGVVAGTHLCRGGQDVRERRCRRDALMPRRTVIPLPGQILARQEVLT
jgi:hypothetical protein